MKTTSYICLLLMAITFITAQTNSSRKYFNHEKKATVNFSKITQDFSPSLLVKEMPKPGSGKIVYYNYPETKEKSKLNQKTQTQLSSLNLGTNFLITFIKNV